MNLEVLSTRLGSKMSRHGAWLGMLCCQGTVTDELEDKNGKKVVCHFLSLAVYDIQSRFRLGRKDHGGLSNGIEGMEKQASNQFHAAL